MDFFHLNLNSLEVLEQTQERIVVKLKDIPIQYANALRRICLTGIPIFAIEDVVFIENSSVLADESIAHRLAMIPLVTDLSRFNEPSKCSCQREAGCTNCRVMLMIDSGSSDNTRTVYSSELTSEDDTVKPVNGKIPVVELAPGQSLKLEAYARLGRGYEHAKWNSSNVATLTEGDNESEKILTIETTGSLSATEILDAAVEELSNRLEEFKQKITAL